MGGTAKKPFYKLDLEASGVSQDTDESHITLTLAKGDKVQIAGFDRNLAALIPDNTGCVKVSSKGLLTARKVTGPEGVTISFLRGRPRVFVKVVVIQPVLEDARVDGHSSAIIKKYKADVQAGKDFDILLYAPLNTSVYRSKVKMSGGVITEDNNEIITVNSNGMLHIRGKAISKGKSKIPFTCCGKKYTLIINVKDKGINL